MHEPIDISIVTPVYYGEHFIQTLVERIIAQLSTLVNNFEIIMVNDASPDNSWSMIELLSKQDSRIKGINLSRNFGQHYAISAGLEYAKGRYVVIMDCDLQDLPEEIPTLYNKIREGYDIVLGRRHARQDSLFRKIISKTFYCLFNYLTDSKKESDVAFFVIIQQRVAQNLRRFVERHRFMPSLLDWLGYQRAYVYVKHAPRASGKSSYTLKKLLTLSMDAILSHSNKPLKLIIKFGFSVSLLSIIYICYTLYLYAINGIEVSGWTSLIVSIWLVTGIVMTTLGVLGMYIDKIYYEVKSRPLYVIKETTFELDDVNG